MFRVLDKVSTCAHRIRDLQNVIVSINGMIIWHMGYERLWNRGGYSFLGTRGRNFEIHELKRVGMVPVQLNLA